MSKVSEADAITYGAAILLFEREYKSALEGGANPDDARKVAIVSFMKIVRGVSK